MRWFKHLCNAHNDEIMAEILEELGVEGYGCWWIILEKIGAQMDKSDRCSAKYSWRNWAHSCRVSTKKFKKIITKLTFHNRLAVENDGKFVKISCPNLLKYRDEYSRKSGQAPDIVRSLSGETPEQKQKQKQIYNSVGSKELVNGEGLTKCTKCQTLFKAKYENHELCLKCFKKSTSHPTSSDPTCLKCNVSMKPNLLKLDENGVCEMCRLKAERDNQEDIPKLDINF